MKCLFARRDFWVFSAKLSSSANHSIGFYIYSDKLYVSEELDGLFAIWLVLFI